jgi:hypothetical protein
MPETDYGQVVYEAHHAVMHEQTGRRQSHHKAYENLTPKVRARYVAAGQAVAGPLEADNARLRDALAAVQRERDEAEDENRKLLRAWPRCPAGCNCRVGVEDDPDRNECGCEGPCNGGGGTAPRGGPAGTAVYLATIARLAAGLRDIRDANPGAPAGAYARDRAVLALGALPPGIPPGFDGVGRLRDAIAGHECSFAPGLPGPCECGSAYADGQVRRALAEYLAERAGGYVTAAMVRRRVRVGYARAMTELNRLADEHVISTPDSKGRYTVHRAPATAAETITEGKAR